MTPYLRTFLFADPMSTRLVRAALRVEHWIAMTAGPALLLAAGLSVAVVTGFMIPEHGMLVLAMLLAGITGAVSVIRPEIGLSLFTLMLFTRASENLTASLGVPSIAPLFAVAMLSALVAREGIGTLFRTRRVYWMPIIIYGLVLLASIFVAVNKEIVLSTTTIYVKEMVFIAVIVLYARTIRDARTVIWSLIIAGLIPSLLTIYQTFSGSTSTFLGFGQYSAQIVVPGEVVEVPRPSGQVGDPNFFALSLLILIPLAWHRVRYERSRLLRHVAAAAGLVMTLAAILTYSRGAYIALAIMLVAAAVAGFIRFRTLAIAGVIVVLLLPILPDSYTSRLTTLADIAVRTVQDDGAGAEATSDSSYTGRMVQLMAGVNMFADYPVLGVGTHNYPEHYQDYSRQLGTTRRSNRTPHNLYVEIASETGFAGLTAFSLVIGALSLWLRGVWRSAAQPPELRDLARALAVAMTGFLVGSIFLHNAYPRFWWILIALVLVTAVVADERSRLRPAVRMRAIKRLNPLEEARVRHRLRLGGAGAALAILAIITVMIVDARFQDAGTQFVPRREAPVTVSDIPFVPVTPE